MHTLRVDIRSFRLTIRNVNIETLMDYVRTAVGFRLTIRNVNSPPVTLLPGINLVLD